MAQTTLSPTQQIAALERQRDAFREQHERYWRALDVLYHVSVACRGARSFREIFEVTYRELAAVFTLDACYIAVCDTRQPELFRAAYRVDEGQAEYVEQQPRGRLTSLVLERRTPLLFQDLLNEELQPNNSHDRFGNPNTFARAWIGVPLLIGQDVIGVLSVQSYTPNFYNTSDLDLLQRIGNVVGVALENVTLAQQQHDLGEQLAARVAARTEELMSLSALIGEMVLQRPLDDVLDRALALILPLLDVKAGKIRRYDRKLDVLVLLAQRGDLPQTIRELDRLSVPDTVIGGIVYENRPLLIASDLAQFKLANTPERYQSLLGVPLRIGDQVVGSLAVLDDRPREFDAGQVDFTQVLGNQIALAIENARLLQERERQIAELRALSTIARTAATAFDLPTLLRQVQTSLSSFMQLDAFFMMVYDAEQQLIIEGLGIDNGTEYTYFKNAPLPPRSLTAWVVNHRRTLHFQNVPEQIKDYPELTEQLIGVSIPAVTWLGVPLFDRDEQVIGTLGIQGYTAHAFSERDERFLEDVAQQVSLHVQHVRLLTERERRIRELDAIGQIGQLISASYDLEEMLQQVYVQLQNITGAPVFYMVICEPETHVITHSAYIEDGVQEPDQWRGQRTPEGSLTQVVLRTRQPLLVDDLLERKDDLKALGVATERFNPARSTRAWVGVPLLAKEGQPIGLISVQDFQPAQYSQRTIEFLSQVASHLSLGVQKVRLFEERERQLAENARLFAAEQDARHMADTLREVARVLSSSFDAGEVPQMILHELRKVIPYDAASILMLQENLFRIALQDNAALTEMPRHITFRIDQLNAAKTVVLRRAPLLIADTETAPEWSPTKDQRSFRSWLGIPLISKGVVLGVLNISAISAGRFTERDAEVALAFASQAAVAMENARLYQESVTRVEQELEIASRIQRNLFPRALPQVAGLELAAWCLPARETGGDFYDVVPLREESEAGRAELAFIVGDASGKSIPAAMLMAIARSITRSEARDHRTPPDVMRETNRWIALDVPPRSFVALCYATLDLQDRRLALANAGQLAPIRRQRDGQVSYLEVPGNTLPLGIQPGTPYDTLEVALAAGDLLLFYTDGIVEAQNHAHELFGFERLEELVRAHGDLAPADLIQRIIYDVEHFAGNAPQHDDMTIVALRLE